MKADVQILTWPSRICRMRFNCPVVEGPNGETRLVFPKDVTVHGSEVIQIVFDFSFDNPPE